MSTPFSTNPKLSDWIPSEQQILTITAARELWDLVPEEEGDETNKSCINILNVYSHLHPEIADPQKLADDAQEWVHNVVAYRNRHEGGN